MKRAFTINCQKWPLRPIIEQGETMGKSLVLKGISEIAFGNESGPRADPFALSFIRMRRCIDDELGRTQANCKSIEALLF